MAWGLSTSHFGGHHNRKSTICIALRDGGTIGDSGASNCLYPFYFMPVPPASSVMTMRLSLVYCCMVDYARAAARLANAVQVMYKIAASGIRKLSCTEL